MKFQTKLTPPWPRASPRRVVRAVAELLRDIHHLTNTRWCPIIKPPTFTGLHRECPQKFQIRMEPYLASLESERQQVMADQLRDGAAIWQRQFQNIDVTLLAYSLRAARHRLPDTLPWQVVTTCSKSKVLKAWRWKLAAPLTQNWLENNLMVYCIRESFWFISAEINVTPSIGMLKKNAHHPTWRAPTWTMTFQLSRRMT